MEDVTISTKICLTSPLKLRHSGIKCLMKTSSKKVNVQYILISSYYCVHRDVSPQNLPHSTPKIEAFGIRHSYNFLRKICTSKRE